MFVLFAMPALIYQPAIFHRYGFRDDYSILREARDEPGKVIRVCSMQARPVYGWLLENSFRLARSIEDFAWIRLGAALLLGGVAVAFFLVLGRLGWDRGTAALLAAILTILPAAQVLVSWAVAWPLAVSVLLALCGFVCAENAFKAAHPATTAAWWAVSVAFVCGSALDYQPNSVFYFVLLAAALVRRRWAGRETFEWLVRHVVTAFIGVGCAFTVMMVAFARNWVPASHRIALDHDWLGKALWFVAAPLQNALALISINENGGSRLASFAAAAALLLIGAGILRQCRKSGQRQGLWLAAALATAVVGSFAVNLVVGDRWPVYRVIMPLSATVLVAFALALGWLGGVRLARGGLLALLIPGVWLARTQTFDLIAWPQSVELQVLETGARRIDPARNPRIYVITPRPADHVGSRMYADEFGSLSTDSDWVPKEMLHLIMENQHPRQPDVAKRYEFWCGRVVPKKIKFDVIIDLRAIRDFRGITPVP